MKKTLLRLVRQSPAMVVAMIALFVALSGTAVATTSALIGGNQIRNSSIAGIDIKNNSLTGADVKNKSLTAKDFRGSIRGARGSAGPPGPQGPQGSQGPQGIQGPGGPLLNTLPPGATLRGMYAWADRTGAAGYHPVVPLSYQFPLATSPAINVVGVGGASTPACPGTAANPQAAPGNLCVYQTRNDGNQAFSVLNEVQGGRFGAVLYFPIAASTDYEYQGTWAVTAATAPAAAAKLQATGTTN